MKWSVGWKRGVDRKSDGEERADTDSVRSQAAGGRRQPVPTGGKH